MNFRDLTTRAYLDYHDVIDSRAVSFDHPLLPYEYPSDGRLQYDWQEDDFTRELVNKFNEFVMSVYKLRQWEHVIAKYSLDDQYELRSEFSNALLENSIGYPFRYKSNLIFCATTLCYIDGLSRKTLSRKDIKKPSDITLKSFKLISEQTAGSEEFLAAVEKIDDIHYRQSTSNFRNRLQHQHAPRLEHGQISHVNIDFPNEEGTSFEFGVQEPLKTEKLLPILDAQIEPMRRAFFAYRNIVDGHIGIRT